MLKYEKIEVDLGVMAKIVSFKNQNAMTYYSMHFHDSYELLYCKEGTLHVGMSNNEYIMHPGDVIFLNSNVVHETKSVEPNHAYMIHLKQVFFDNNRSYIDLNTVENAKIKSMPVYENIIQLMIEIYDINKEKLPHYQHLVLSKLELLKYQLLNSFLKNKPHDYVVSVDTHLNMTQIMHYINLNYNRGITVSDIALEFDYSLPYFSHIFKKYTGITCLQYIQKLRLESAMKKLIHLNDTIENIAYEVGFPNVKAMRLLFKKELGVSPSEYVHIIKGNLK